MHVEKNAAADGLSPEPGVRRHESASGNSVSELLRGLIDDTTRLIAQEVALAKSELAEGVRNAQAGLISVAIAGITLAAGAFYLLLAAVYALSTVIAPWLAALSVGGAVTLVGIIMLLRARSKLSKQALMPDRTLRSLRKDERMVKQATA